MSSRPHYFAIGLFVLAATALGVFGIILFGSDAMREPRYFMETYVDESVQGIEVGTPFKFRGVKVGNIHEIRMVSEVYETAKVYIMIRVALDEKVFTRNVSEHLERTEEMVDEGLRVKMVPQGITGLSFLDADFYPDGLTDPLEIDWEPGHTYIPSTPAMMTVIGRSIEHITAQVNTLDLEQIGANVEQITSNLNLSVQHIEQITREAAGISDDIMADVHESSENLTAMVADMRQMVNDSDSDVDQILTNLRYITEETRELVRMIKRSPSMLLTEPPERNLSQGGEKR